MMRQSERRRRILNYMPNPNDIGAVIAACSEGSSKRAVAALAAKEPISMPDLTILASTILANLLMEMDPKTWPAVASAVVTMARGAAVHQLSSGDAADIENVSAAMGEAVGSA